MKLLLIEDDKNILSLLEDGLKENGHTIDTADNGRDGQYLACTYQYDVILVDWMLPFLSGIQIIQSIRSQKIDTPIIMLTAKDTLHNTIEGLQIGCDDYLTKPFLFEELEARMEALHRRNIKNYRKEILYFDDIVINTQTKTLFKKEKELHLSSKELHILFLLIENKNSFVSKGMMEDMLYNTEKIVSSNVISVTIHNLRKKIGGDIIKNFRGLGYKIEI